MSIISARLPPRSIRKKAELSRHAASPLYDILRFEIVSLSLKPGSVINRVDIQNRFGVSSTPLRDALVKEFKASLSGKAPPFPEEDMVQRKKDYLTFLLGEDIQ